jgi:hypothetical protein
MEAVDVAKVEAPRAPGGMTGGVEFEAMNYLVCLFVVFSSITVNSHIDFALQAVERRREGCSSASASCRSRTLSGEVPP